MKKSLMLVGILMLGAGVAFASSINIPWFLDPGPEDGAYPPAAGNVKTFITIHNNTADPLVCTIEYRRPDGTPSGPEGQNTFELPGNTSWGFRPAATDPGAGDNTNVPIATFFGGSAKISWEGEPWYIQGRLIEIHADRIYGYLLPPGF